MNFIIFHISSIFKFQWHYKQILSHQVTTIGLASDPLPPKKIKYILSFHLVQFNI